MLYSVDHIDFNHNEMEFYKFAIVPINKLDGLHKKAIFNYSKDLINNDVSLNFNTKEPLEFIDNSEKVFISVHSSIFHFVVHLLDIHYNQVHILVLGLGDFHVQYSFLHLAIAQLVFPYSLD